MEYIELCDIQNLLINYYTNNHSCLTMPEAVKILFRKGGYIKTEREYPFPSNMSQVSDDDYIGYFEHAQLPVNYIVGTPLTNDWREAQYRNLQNRHYIRIYRHFNYNAIESDFHTHKHFEIVFVIRGKCTMNFEKIELTLKSGDVCLIAPGSQHGISIMDDSSFVLNVIVSKPAFETIFMQILQDGDLISRYLQSMLYSENIPNYLFVRTSNSEELKFYIKSATYESHSDNIYSYSKAMSWLTLFLDTVFGEFRSTIHSYQNKNLAMQESHMELIQYIQDNFQTVTLEVLAQKFNYNKSYLSRLLRNIMGKSFVELLNLIRIEHACDYLATTDLKLLQISELCGFDNQNYFNKVFKKYKGLAPSEYRSRADFLE